MNHTLSGFFAGALLAIGAMPAASAATVTYDATETDGGDAAIFIETQGPDPFLFGTASLIDVVIEVDGRTFTLAEQVFDTFFGVFDLPYDISVAAGSDAVSFVAPPGTALPPNGLTALTLRFAAPLGRTPTVENVLSYLVTGRLKSFSAEAEGQRFDAVVGQVPLPGALILFATGALGLGTRRLAA